MSYYDRVDLLRSGLLIHGDWVDKGGGGSYWHVNPATGKKQAEVPLAGVSDVDRAVESARAGLLSWKALPAGARRSALQRVAALVAEQAEEFAIINALE